MALQLSGTLHRPAVDQPLKNTRVLFRARVTSADTIMGATAEITTDENGAYTVSLYSGRYDIGAYINGHLHYLARDVLIDDESTAETLNELILHDEYNDDITPAVIVEFRALRKQAIDAAEAAEALYGSLAAVQQSEQAAAQREAGAEAGATRSETASSAAVAAVNLQPDIATGIANTSSGEAFSIAEGDNGYLVLYRNDGGNAIELSRYPGLGTFLNVMDSVRYALDLAGQAAAYASRDSVSDKRINQLLQTIAYAIDIASQTARAAPAAYLRALGAALYVDSQGRIGIGTNTPGAPLDIAGGRLRLRTSQPPASATAPGLPGELAWDSQYEYRCVAANTWRRIPLQTW